MEKKLFVNIFTNELKKRISRHFEYFTLELQQLRCIEEFKIYSMQTLNGECPYMEKKLLYTITTTAFLSFSEAIIS